MNEYRCEHFLKLEDEFHSSKILSEEEVKKLSELIFDTYGFFRPSLIGRIEGELMSRTQGNNLNEKRKEFIQ